MIYTMDDLHLFYKPGNQISNKDGTRKVISFIPDMEDFNEKYRILNLQRLYYKKKPEYEALPQYGIIHMQACLSYAVQQYGVDNVPPIVLSIFNYMDLDNFICQTLKTKYGNIAPLDAEVIGAQRLNTIHRNYALHELEWYISSDFATIAAKNGMSPVMMNCVQACIITYMARMFVCPSDLTPMKVTLEKFPKLAPYFYPYLDRLGAGQTDMRKPWTMNDLTPEENEYYHQLLKMQNITLRDNIRTYLGSREYSYACHVSMNRPASVVMESICYSYNINYINRKIIS